MNVDRGQTSFSEQEIQGLRDRLQQYKQFEGLSWKALENQTGIPAGTLSQWAPGKYLGDNEAVAFRVNKFFLHEEARKEVTEVAPLVPGFRFTKTANRITATLRWAHEGEFALVIGAAGVSKTSSIRQYKANNPNVFVATMAPHTRSVNGMLLQLCHALELNERRSGGSYTLAQLAISRLIDRRAVVIIDEAQHLSDVALEQLRYIHDVSGAGLVLSGNPTVLTRVTGGARRAEFAQLDSRISLPHVIKHPDPEDIAIMLDAWTVRDEREREFMAKIAMSPGALRKFTQVLKLATLIARGDGEDRCLAHLQAAWAQQSRSAVAA